MSCRRCQRAEITLGNLILIFGRAGAKKPSQRHTLALGLTAKLLIKKVLSPLRVGPPDHPHNMPAGMQREGTRLLKQLHISLSQQPVPLAAIARMAAGNQVFPRGRPAAGSRNHVIQRQIGGREQHAAVLACVAVVQKNFFAGQSSRLVRNTAILQQPYDRWHTHSQPRRMQKVSILLFRHGQTLQHQDDRATSRTDINGLIGRIQHQHRSLHQHAFPRLGWLFWGFAIVAFVSLVPFMHGPVFLRIERWRPSPQRSLLLWWPVLPWPQKLLWRLPAAAPVRTLPRSYR